MTDLTARNDKPRKAKNNTERAYELLLMLDAETIEHSFRVGDLSAEILKEYLKDNPVELDYGPDVLRLAAALHDVGKLRVPQALLCRPGPLSEEESATVRRHPVYGQIVLKEYLKRSDPVLRRVAYEVALGHHERIDGGGYPSALKGDEIPLSAQIAGLADCYDAVTSVRPYRTAETTDRALRLIRSGRCGAFDEKLVSCLLAVVERQTEGR